MRKTFITVSSLRWWICFEQEELTQMALSHNLTLAFSSESSVQAELSRESSADAITIMVNEMGTCYGSFVIIPEKVMLRSCVNVGKLFGNVCLYFHFSWRIFTIDSSCLRHLKGILSYF